MKFAIMVLSTLVGLSIQQQCDPINCRLPNCRCFRDPTTPGGLSIYQTPQIVMVSFEGTINNQDIKNYLSVFENVVNPNNCPATGTFFIDDYGTDYSLVKDLYGQGHEIGVHSVDGKIPGSPDEWVQSIKKVVDQLDKNGVDRKSVNGIRAPELSIGGDDEFIAFGSSGSNLVYDSSCVNVQYSTKSTYLWPFTLDFMPAERCDIGTAPYKLFPGKWEMPIADLHDLVGDKLPCPVPSACRNINTKRDAFDLFFNAFADHITGARTPFVMIVDPAWAANDVKMEGTREFLQYIRVAYKEAWVVPMYKGLQWIQNPVPLDNITYFKPWQC